MSLARPVAELEHVDDCVEEILVRFNEALAMAFINPERAGIYDKILEVVLRAREVPLLANAPGSSPQIGWPSQLP